MRVEGLQRESKRANVVSESKRASPVSESRGSVSEPKRASSAANASKSWSCYILECADHSFYIGVATDVADREKEHNSGHGSKHTYLRRPVRVMWSRECPTYADARSLEARLKGWSRAKKSRLIAGSLRFRAVGGIALSAVEEPKGS